MIEKNFKVSKICQGFLFYSVVQFFFFSQGNISGMSGGNCQLRVPEWLTKQGPKLLKDTQL